MDKINFELTEVTPIKNTNLKDYDVRVVLNGTALGHVIFNTDTVVPAARFNFAEFDLFTCGCGVPGCAGFHTSVIQKKTDNSVKWTFPTDKSYNVEKLEYEFDRIEFEHTVESLRTKMLELEKDNIYPISSVSDDSSYGDNTACEVRSSLTESFQWQEDHYNAKQKFEAMLQEKFPTYLNKAFAFKYDGKISKETLDFEYLVCRTINEWPSREKLAAYLKKAEASGNAIVEMLSTQNYKPLAKMVYSAYKQFANSKAEDNHTVVMWDTFNYQLEEISQKEKFDLSKLKLVTV
jgi:hypothetical protein